MNTHDIDIELPAEFRSGNDIPVTQATIKRERMEEIVRAAIEADRKRRGEPVYQVNMKGNGWEDCTLDRYESAGRVIEQDAQRGWKRWERRVLWSAPQPAEPRLDAPAQVGHTRFGEGVPWSTVIGAAQRYHAAQNTPAKEQERLQRAAENIKALHQAEPVKCPDPSMGEHACSNRAQCWEPCGELGKSIDHAEVAETCRAMGANSFAEFFGKTAPQRAEPSGHSIQDCPEDDKWNCKYCRRVNACPVQGSRDEQPAEPVREVALVAACCGRSECGGECGNDWQGMVAAEPVKVPSDAERATQGLPPYKPRKPTEEERNRLIENGRKAWGKRPVEPVKVPSDEEIEALVRKTASDVFGIGEAAYDQDDREFYGRFARALLARYGRQDTMREPPSSG